jgi:hypothetical protein
MQFLFFFSNVQGENRSWRETIHVCLRFKTFFKIQKCSTMDLILFKNVQGENLFKVEFGSSTFKAKIRSRWISQSSNIIV